MRNRGMNKTVLVLNAGSSSVTFTVYPSDGAQLTMRYHGQIAGLGSQPHWLTNRGHLPLAPGSARGCHE